MPDLRQTRKNLKTALAVMAAWICWRRSCISRRWSARRNRGAEMNQLQTELNTKTRQVAPLKDLPQKVVLASKQIADFYKKRFPTQNSADC